MVENDWRVIVDWNFEAEADALLGAWLRRNSVTRAEIGADLREDLTRSVDGIRRIRYSVRTAAWEPSRLLISAGRE
jgi:hypothetical protein